MKIEEEEQSFKKVRLTLETQEEFDFLLGLLNGGAEKAKISCRNYSMHLNTDMYKLLDNLK